MGTKVSGMCRPGSGLLHMIQDSEPPVPETCCILVADANDIGAGNLSIVCRHLRKLHLQTPDYCFYNILPLRSPQQPSSKWADKNKQQLHCEWLQQILWSLSFGRKHSWLTSLHWIWPAHVNEGYITVCQIDNSQLAETEGSYIQTIFFNSADSSKCL